MESITDSNVNNAAREYIRQGWCVLPLKPKDKDCLIKSWQTLRIKEGEVDEYFWPDSNIGILLGEVSGGLTDVDLDCPEALAIGPRFLPDTLRSGRGDKVTHFWYVSTGSKSKKYADVTGDTIIELRSDNRQTAVEPSIHPSGEQYTWVDPDIEPQEINKAALRSRVARVAVSSLIARPLPENGRHDLALAYAGLMLRPLLDLGEDKNDAIEYVRQRLKPAWEYHDAPNKGLEDLYNCIEDTADKIEADEPATGAPKLEELLEHGQGIAKKIKDWLGWGELTPEQREEVEQRKRVKKANKAWDDPRVQELAHDLDILSSTYMMLQADGLVGEERNAKLMTLVSATRHLGQPMSVIIDGESSGGKSYLLKMITKTLPEEFYYRLQSVSDKALAYIGEDTLKNRFLQVYELGGMGKEGEQALEMGKQLLTEGAIERQIAESTPKGVKGRLVRTNGPTGLWTTTTRYHIDRELKNRALSITIDESPEQTARINKSRKRRKVRRKERSVDFTPIRNLHTWLAGQQNDVDIPFEDIVADRVDHKSVRMRRFYDYVMTLVEAHAVLHRARRASDSDGWIIATIDDYRAVYDLVADILGEAAETSISKSMRGTVEAVQELIEEEETVTRDTVAKKLKITPTPASRRLGAAKAAGYVKPDPDARDNKTKVYVLGDIPMPEKDRLALPHPDEIEDVCKRAEDAEGPGVAADSAANSDEDSCTHAARVPAHIEGSVAATTQKALSNGDPGEDHHEHTVSTTDPLHAMHACTHQNSAVDQGLEEGSVHAPVHDVCVPEGAIVHERGTGYMLMVGGLLQKLDGEEARQRLWANNCEIWVRKSEFGGTNHDEARKEIQQIRDDWYDFPEKLPTNAEGWARSLEYQGTPFTLEAIERALEAA